MENSPTGNPVETTGATTSPTGQGLQENTAELNQETNSREQSQEVVSDDTANNQTQTQQNGGGSTTDDGLAGFAKSQGIDLETASETEKRLLKVALDNQRAARNNTNGAKITDATESLGDGSIEAEVAQLKYERTTDRFWSQEGRDKSLEPEMVSILNEKVAELTPQLGEADAKKYAFQLSRDLDTLYGLAQLRKGGLTPGVDPDAIRREERESIKRQAIASADNAHASTHVDASTKIDREWLSSQYDPSNPEHRKLVDAAVANGDL